MNDPSLTAKACLFHGLKDLMWIGYDVDVSIVLHTLFLGVAVPILVGLMVWMGD